ncbi:MAG: hypothetical protein KC547_13420 [Anaerolineae bacterium]|nr:hypothetical protein [Anaerolineae bacterium]
MQFLSIYIREAHPIDGWWLGKPPFSWVFRYFEPRAATHVYDPKTIAERRAVASECKSALQYGIRTYVDEMDDAVNLAYMAWPTRLYLVGLDGRVVYRGGIGPFGFKPKELEAAIGRIAVNPT